MSFYTLKTDSRLDHERCDENRCQFRGHQFANHQWLGGQDALVIDDSAHRERAPWCFTMLSLGLHLIQLAKAGVSSGGPRQGGIASPRSNND